MLLETSIRQYTSLTVNEKLNVTLYAFGSPAVLPSSLSQDQRCLLATNRPSFAFHVNQRMTLPTAATLAASCAMAINAVSATAARKPSEKANNSSQITLP
jgi:hypothetical protein